MSMMRQNVDNNQPIIPGPCPVNPETGVQECPPPKEIVCVNVDKVYDFCVQTDFRFECFDIPANCNPPFPAGTTIECQVVSTTCREIPPRTPAPGFPAGFFNVTVEVAKTLEITVRNPNGTVRCTFTRTVRFIKIVLLFAPAGTRIDCRVLAATCSPPGNPPRVVDGQICVKLEECIEIQALALVKLLVPAYGFCVPAECVPAAQPEFPCPPGELFPNQPTKLHVHIEWQSRAHECIPSGGSVQASSLVDVKKMGYRKDPPPPETDADVDLYMKLPTGDIVNFVNPLVTFPGGFAQLLADHVVDPGPEDIVVINPPNGTYCICTHLFSGQAQGPVKVTATYTYQDGQGRVFTFGPFTGCLFHNCQFHNFPSFLLPQVATGTPCACV